MIEAYSSPTGEVAMQSTDGGGWQRSAAVMAGHLRHHQDGRPSPLYKAIYAARANPGSGDSASTNCEALASQVKPRP